MTYSMDTRDEFEGASQFRQLLLCFQCQRVPVSLIHRACDFKSTWSSAGEIKLIPPHEGGVPKWLLDFWPTNQRLPDHGTTTLGLSGIRVVKDCGIEYFEIQPSYSTSDVDEKSQDAYMSQCICVFNHAFPCRNTEILGEEVISCLLPLAKAFLLPLLASISEGYVRAWLLPKERIEFPINLFDCLQQIYTLLGPRSPLRPTSFPHKILKVLRMRMATHQSERNPMAEACLRIFVDTLDLLSSASLEIFKRSIFSATTVLDQRANAWTGICLGVLLSSKTAKWPQSLSDAIINAAACWRPKSEMKPSSMEYLVALELLSPVELQSVLRPSLFSVEHRILRGLLLSRKRYHNEAIEAMEEALPDAITGWGLESFQVGIAAAESANCYNILRKEDVANTLATRCLAARNMPELTSRRDWFYLSVCLIDSLIGSGRYTEAEPAIQRVMNQPSIPPSIHMMACLRLSKVHRRAPRVSETAAESHRPLQKGLDLFFQVPIPLREEYLEEVSCRLSMGGITQEMLRLQETLMNTVDDLLGQTGTRESPAKKRYTQVQLALKQQTPRQENSVQKRDRQLQLDLKHQIPQQANLAQNRYTPDQPNWKQGIPRRTNHPSVLGDKVRLGVVEAPPHSHYPIAWICALPIEMMAARAMLDDIHPDLPQDEGDKNTYMLGNIGPHNIVIACLPNGHYGTNNAASVSTNLLRSFPSICKGFMVGIGGGVPSRADIRLGDVVVGTRVMQYDLGKIVDDGNIQRTAIARIPDSSFGTAVSAMRTLHEEGPSRVSIILENMATNNPEYGYPASPDRLFPAPYKHESQLLSCSSCDQSKLLPRSTRKPNSPKIHHGAIASGNQVVKDSITRDTIARELDIICFEMEAAGLMDVLPCLPIRGICDYADSHKSKEWQRYAAATAAACAKELIETLPTNNGVLENESIPNSLSQDASRFRRQLLLESFKFEQIDSRKISIKTAHSKTCHWFLKDPQYLEWLDPQKHAQHHGFLWIRGKPGAGKSTIMKFIYLKTKRKKSHTNEITASFFFHARGEDLEKSIPGMYRSLLLQLLEGYPDLQGVLDDTELIPQGQDGCPPLNVLKDLFYNAVSSLGRRSFTCFIDALDECDEQQVMEMVSYFEDLAEICTNKGVWFQICFSSRHYPYIRIRQGIGLTLEHQQGHSEDMDNYIQSNLRIRDVALIEELRPQMLEKAAGVFLWVVLVVDFLNKESQRGRLALRKRFAEIPSGLSEFFKDSMRRDNDNMEDFLLCILWILCAKRSLRPEEYYHALWSGLAVKDLVDPDIPNVTALDFDECVESYVITSSKGFAEITEVKSRTGRTVRTVRTIQFIHRCVRDFLIDDKGIVELWPNLGFDWQSSGHEILKQCCSTYINHELVRASVGSPHGSTDKRRFPFLEYASQHILTHSNAAAEAIPQNEFLSQISIPHWVTMVNLFENYEVRKYTSKATMIYILADKGFSLLIRTWLRENPLIDIRGERYEYPLFAALANGNKDAVAALLNLTSPQFDGVDITEGFELKKDLKGYRGRTPLTWAAQEGQMSLAKLLMQKGADPNDTDRGGSTPLMRASQAGQQAIVTFFIKMGAEINGFNRQGDTALSLALGHGNLAIAKVLVRSGAKLEPHPDTLKRALFVASKEGHEATASFLVENGTKLDAIDSSGYTALSRASSNGHLTLVKLLLKSGAQIEPGKGVRKSRPALIEASRNGQEAVVMFLIEQGANIEIRGEGGSTPLIEASKNSHAAVVRLLIRSGADVDTKDEEEKTALGYAKSPEIEAYLLGTRPDANADAEDDPSQTPFHDGSFKAVRSEPSVKSFIKREADIDTKETLSHTPLYMAYKSPGSESCEEKADSLIDKWEDVDASDMAATRQSHRAVEAHESEAMKHLIEEGGDDSYSHSSDTSHIKQDY